MIGLSIIIIVVGRYSVVNQSTFDFVIDPTIFYLILGITAVLGLLARIIPSVIAIRNMKQKMTIE